MDATRSARRPLTRSEPRAPIATLVPANSELVVEALILNRDVGFVTVGQRVVVKLEAFPFTRHGFLEGLVEHVSADAIADETRGLVFPATIGINGSQLRDVESILLARGEMATVNTRWETSMSASEATDRSTQASAPPRSRSYSVLSAGMSAQVEIITGRRRVISYLLSPIARAVNEAGRER